MHVGFLNSAEVYGIFFYSSQHNLDRNFSNYLRC